MQYKDKQKTLKKKKKTRTREHNKCQKKNFNKKKTPFIRYKTLGGIHQ